MGRTPAGRGVLRPGLAGPGRRRPGSGGQRGPGSLRQRGPGLGPAGGADPGGGQGLLSRPDGGNPAGNRPDEGPAELRDSGAVSGQSGGGAGA